jgi:carbon starvation protein
VVTLLVAFLLAKVGYASIWPLFGSANQLLSALALIACAVFFKRTRRKGFMLWAPMCIMLVVTLSALAITIFTKFTGLVSLTSANPAGDTLQLCFAVALLILGIIVAIQGLRKMFQKEEQAAPAAVK